jgi:hypothetical protein
MSGSAVNRRFLEAVHWDHRSAEIEAIDAEGIVRGALSGA